MSEQKRTQEQIAALAREAEHRSKNLLANAGRHRQAFSVRHAGRGWKRAAVEKDAFGRLPMFIRSLSRRAGLALSCRRSRDRSLRPILRRARHAPESMVQKSCWSRASPNPSPSFCTSWRPMRRSTVHCLWRVVELTYLGRMNRRGGLNFAGLRQAVRQSTRRHGKGLADGSLNKWLNS